LSTAATVLVGQSDTERDDAFQSTEPDPTPLVAKDADGTLEHPEEAFHYGSVSIYQTVVLGTLGFAASGFDRSTGPIVLHAAIARVHDDSEALLAKATIGRANVIGKHGMSIAFVERALVVPSSGRQKGSPNTHSIRGDCDCQLPRVNGVLGRPETPAKKVTTGGVEDPNWRRIESCD
jgi:hypothetical protein